MKLCLNVFGSPYSYGCLPAGATKRSAADLLREAAARGLPGVELPDDFVDVLDAPQIARIGQLRSDLGLYMVFSTFGTEPAQLMRAVEAGAAMGASIVRTVAGGADYGGDRRAFAGGRWKQFLETTRDRLAQALTVAERHQVSLAVEDHQDLNSEDLLWLCDALDSSRFGIVLDTANPLSVAEHPVDFARATAPHIKHVHLKDYRIYLSPSGYLLVRCASGEGVIPFAEILQMLREHGSDEWASVEVGAIEARHVRAFEDDFWPEYPPRSAAQFARVAGFVLRHAEPIDAEYRTPHELGRPAAEIVEYERAQAEASLRNMKNLVNARPAVAFSAVDGEQVS